MRLRWPSCKFKRRRSLGDLLGLTFLLLHPLSVQRLTAYLSASPSRQKSQASTSKVHRLERRVDMRQNAMGITSQIALSGAVDLEHSGKNQASRVDVAKLAKAEAKIKVGKNFDVHARDFLLRAFRPFLGQDRETCSSRSLRRIQARRTLQKATIIRGNVHESQPASVGRSLQGQEQRYSIEEYRCWIRELEDSVGSGADVGAWETLRVST